VKTVAVATQIREVLPTVVAQQRSPLYSTILIAPHLAPAELQTLIASE